MTPHSIWVDTAVIIRFTVPSDLPETIKYILNFKFELPLTVHSIYRAKTVSPDGPGKSDVDCMGFSTVRTGHIVAHSSEVIMVSEGLNKRK